jgi:hypothetical protein
MKPGKRRRPSAWINRRSSLFAESAKAAPGAPAGLQACGLPVEASLVITAKQG